MGRGFCKPQPCQGKESSAVCCSQTEQHCVQQFFPTAHPYSGHRSPPVPRCPEEAHWVGKQTQITWTAQATPEEIRSQADDNGAMHQPGKILQMWTCSRSYFYRGFFFFKKANEITMLNELASPCAPLPMPSISAAQLVTHWGTALLAKVMTSASADLQYGVRQKECVTQTQWELSPASSWLLEQNRRPHRFALQEAPGKHKTRLSHVIRDPKFSLIQDHWKACFLLFPFKWQKPYWKRMLLGYVGFYWRLTPE